MCKDIQRVTDLPYPWTMEFPDKLAYTKASSEFRVSEKDLMLQMAAGLLSGNNRKHSDMLVYWDTARRRYYLFLRKEKVSTPFGETSLTRSEPGISPFVSRKRRDREFDVF